MSNRDDTQSQIGLDEYCESLSANQVVWGFRDNVAESTLHVPSSATPSLSSGSSASNSSSSETTPPSAISIASTPSPKITTPQAPPPSRTAPPLLPPELPIPSKRSSSASIPPPVVRTPRKITLQAPPASLPTPPLLPPGLAISSAQFPPGLGPHLPQTLLPNITTPQAPPPSRPVPPLFPPVLPIPTNVSPPGIKYHRPQTQTPPPAPQQPQNPDLQRACVAVKDAHSWSRDVFGPNQRFKVLSMVGYGSNGAVVSVSERLSSKHLAVKISYKHSSVMGTACPIPNEVAAMKHVAQLNPSPHVLQCLDQWEDAGHIYVLMELFKSGVATHPNKRPVVVQNWHGSRPRTLQIGSSDAFDYIASEIKCLSDGLFPLQVIKSMLEQMAKGVHAVHASGLFHGDIKLENFCLQVVGQGNYQFVLADFGHAGEASVAPCRYGSPSKAGPEFLPSSQLPHYGQTADIFALGLVFHQLLARMHLPDVMGAVTGGGLDFAAFVAICEVGGSRARVPIADMVLQQLDRFGVVLLRGMCAVNPADRPTSAEIVGHRFFH
ncbi:hypothetical protein HDU98_008290 [Podochytrium sp. JEL0797]|nr:hypothetical protein HDU98_008290 [Podochytrium sp. JEL0797]